LTASATVTTPSFPEDCVGDLDEGPHNDNLRDVGRRYADISDLQSCVAYIEDWSRRNAR
jgi:maleamate amidohydrolase